MGSYLDKSGLTYLWGKITSLVGGKQDTISDLSTIRSGASAGATAYQKPSSGIPKTDLASAVQTSLGKADSALQSFTETDPVFGASAASGITSSDITNWNGKTSNVGTITGVSANGTSVATSGVANIPAASTSAYGVTKLSSSTSSTSTSLAATASAVRAAYNHGGVTSVNGSTGAVTVTVPTKTSDLTNDSGYLTAHQDISGKADKSATVSTVTYASKKLTKTINGTTTDVVTASTIVTDGGGIKSHQSVVLASGTNSGTMKITVNGTATDNVAVTGFASLVSRVATLEDNSVFYKGHYSTANSPFAKNSAVYFAGGVYVSNAQTSDTPMPVYANNSSNRLLLNDGGFIIASTTVDSDWEEKY